MIDGITTKDRPLRVCLVSTFYPPYNFGGDGIFAHRVANALARRDHHVTVLHSRSAYDLLAAEQPEASYDDHPNVRVVAIRTPLGPVGLLWVHQTGGAGLQGPSLRRWLDGSSFDIIHFNNVSLLGGVGVFRYGTALKLCTLVDHWLVCPMHVLWRLGREQCSRPTCVRCAIAGGRPPQLWRLTSRLRDAARHIDAFLGPSEFTIAMHRSRGLQGRMIHLPQFHSPPEDVGSLPRSTRRPYFLFAGRLEAIKGPQNLVDYFRTHSDTDLLIAGAGDLEPELRRAARDCPNVRILGRVDQRTLQALYAGALATLVPSLCYETFGLVVAESYSAGTPVIAPRHSALAELVSRHGGGLLYETREELHAAMNSIAGSVEMRQRLAGEAAAAYAAELNEDVFVSRYLAIVEGMLAERRVASLARPARSAAIGKGAATS